VTKPFGMDELLARIRATLRRQPANDSQGGSSSWSIRIDLDAHVVTRGGEELRLTPKEFDLLAHLVRNAGKVLTHRLLLGAVWGGDYTEQHEYLRVFIASFRKRSNPIHRSPLHSD
jgi:two-component system KDP operon response regulator KdpE